MPHHFVNVGDGPMLNLWIYGSDRVTRTITETGATVEPWISHVTAEPGLA